MAHANEEKEEKLNLSLYGITSTTKPYSDETLQDYKKKIMKWCEGIMTDRDFIQYTSTALLSTKYKKDKASKEVFGMLSSSMDRVFIRLGNRVNPSNIRPIGAACFIASLRSMGGEKYTVSPSLHMFLAEMIQSKEQARHEVADRLQHLSHEIYQHDIILTSENILSWLQSITTYPTFIQKFIDPGAYVRKAKGYTEKGSPLPYNTNNMSRFHVNNITEEREQIMEYVLACTEEHLETALSSTELQHRFPTMNPENMRLLGMACFILALRYILGMDWEGYLFDKEIYLYMATLIHVVEENQSVEQLRKQLPSLEIEMIKATGWKGCPTARISTENILLGGRTRHTRSRSRPRSRSQRRHQRRHQRRTHRSRRRH